MKKHLFLLAVVEFLGGQFVSGQSHHWPLTADLNDAVGSLNGTNNGVTFESDAVRGPVAYFDGAGYANLPSFINGLTEMTTSVWFRMDEAQVWARIYSFGKGDQTDPKDVMMVIPVSGNENMFRFTLKPVGDQWYDVDFPASLVDIQLDTWYYSTIVLKPDSIIIYHDGVQIFAESGYANPFGTMDDSENALGKSFWPDGMWKGAMSDLRIYDEALTESEVAALYEATLPTVGVKENIAGNNPSVYSYHGKISVDMNTAYTNEMVSVYSITGALVSEKSVSDIGQVKFNTGIYIVKITGSDINYATKVFVE